MLADFLTMHERSHRPLRRDRYAFVGDGRFNMGRSLLVTGAIMGSDVRLVVPDELRPPDDVVAMADDLAADSGARITITDDVAAGVEGVDFVHTDVWVSMGEPKEVWAERAELLRPFQVNADAARGHRQPAGQVHALPARLPRRRDDGRREIAEATGMPDGLEVTDEVFRSPASIVFDQAENRLHTIKAVLVATLELTRSRSSRLAATRCCAAASQPSAANQLRAAQGAAAVLAPIAEPTHRWSSPTATARRSGCWRSRRTPTPTARPTRWTSSAPRPAARSAT